MSVGYIAVAKEQPVAYQPLMLVTINFQDNNSNPTILRLCSHRLVSALGGPQYNGFDYLPLLIKDDLSAAQALSDEGIDQPPSMSIEISDANNSIGLNYEFAIGFKGAILTASFIFWNVDNNDFSTDSIVKFVGRCSSPDISEKSLTITASSKMNMTQTQMPSMQIQKTCSWIFPQTFAARQYACYNNDSPSWECGYSPDATGGGAFGNFAATATLASSLTATALTMNVSIVTAFHGTAWGTGNGDGTGLMNAFSIQNSGFLSSLITLIGFPVVGILEIVLGGSPAAPAGATAINIGHLLASSTILTGDQFLLEGTIYTITANVTTDHLGNAAVAFHPPLVTSVKDGTLVYTADSAGTSLNAPFPAVINSAAGPTGSETVIVTATSGSTWTITRAGQGTTAVAATAGMTVQVPFSTCNLTRPNCIARLGNPTAINVAVDGDILHDTSGRQTGHFSGILWSPVAQVVARPYITGKWEQILNNSNEAKYGDLVPLCYGQTFVEPKIMNVVGDGNYTYMEALCCYGEVSYVYEVIVNGVKIPHTFNDTQLPNVPNELNGSHDLAGGFWAALTSGARNGNLNNDAQHKKQGDCYGSQCCLYIMVPKSLADSSSIPQVQVLLQGAKIRVYTDPTTFTLQPTSNPVWVILDQLIWATWLISEIDIPSFIAAAAIADTQINFLNIFQQVTNVIPNPQSGGGALPYAKFGVSLTLQSRQSSAEVVRGLRNACNAILIPNYDSGLLQIMIKETLALQQPSAVQLSGQNASNYNTAVSSLDADGNSLPGFVAYSFDESNITRKEGGKDTTLRFVGKPLAQSPNSTTVTFQDIENQNGFDSLAKSDTEDITRIHQQVAGNFNVLGTNTFDRTSRVISLFQAESYRGNPRLSVDGQIIGDTGGTYSLEWETSFKAIHLKIGQIVRLSYQQRGISNWLLRIVKVQPGSNGKRIKLTANYHNDIWYLTTFGQQNAPLYMAARNFTNRPPMAWSPNFAAPGAGDSMYAASELNMGIQQTYVSAGDTTTLAAVSIVGQIPVNTFSPTPSPPFVDSQATFAATGGTIPGAQTLFFQICAKTVIGSTYGLSVPSTLSRVTIDPGSTNAVTIPTPYWDQSAAGYVIFAGTNPAKLTYQTDVDFTGTFPSSVPLTSFNVSSWGMPDTQFNDLVPLVNKVMHSGTMGAQVLSCTSTTVQLSLLTGAGMATNMFSGYDASIIGLAEPADPDTASGSLIPIFNFRIASNNGDTFTLGAGLDGTVPNPTLVPRGDGTFGLLPGDTLVVRGLPTYGSDAIGNYLDDPTWVNPLNPLDPSFDVSAVTNANPGQVTTLEAHNYTTGNLVYLQGMNGMTGFPVEVTVTVIDANNYTIGIDTSSLGTYTSGGTSSRFDQGLILSAEKGRMMRAISGKGRGQKVTIQDNTQTRIYIIGDFPVTPDNTTRWVIQENSWQAETPTNPITNSDPTATITMTPQIDNYKSQTIAITVLTEDSSGNRAFDFHSPFRDIFIYGSITPALAASIAPFSVTIGHP